MARRPMSVVGNNSYAGGAYRHLVGTGGECAQSEQCFSASQARDDASRVSASSVYRKVCLGR